MTIEIRKLADNSSEGIENIVKDLTSVVEEEVTAFQTLLDVLVEQQESIVKGDTNSVSSSNEEMETIVAETKRLEKERWGKSKDLSQYLNTDRALSISQIIPLIEEKYAHRLNELKKDLGSLSEKIQNTNKRNRYLLEHSLQFVNNCLHVLTQSQGGVHSYSREGKVDVRETSLYSGLG